jgi:YVTN family beta-propeller protein
VLIANIASSNISVIDTGSQGGSAVWTALSGPAGIAVFEDKVYVANQYACTLSVHNLATGTILTKVSDMVAPNAVAVTPDGSQLYVVNANSQTVWALDRSSLAVRAKIPVAALPTAVAVSADGKTAHVTNGYGYSLTTIDTASNTVKSTLEKVGIYPFSIVLHG